MGLASSLDDVVTAPSTTPTLEVTLNFDDIDDKELDAYIMNENEIKHKSGLWLEANAEYLKQQKGNYL